LSITAVGSSADDNSSYGQLVKVTVKDSAGVVTGLGSNETVNLASNLSTTTFTVWPSLTSGSSGSTGTGTTGVTLSATDFNSGVAYVMVKDTATASTIVLTAKGAGTLSPRIKKDKRQRGEKQQSRKEKK